MLEHTLTSRRRNFIGGALALAALPRSAFTAYAGAPQSGPGLHLFSKILNWLDYDECAETIAAAGFGGIDYTVRPKGHVEPERAAVDLPRAVAAARKQGLTVDMIVTAFTSAADPHAEETLKVAAQCGVKLYRTGYYRYDHAEGVAASLEKFKRELAGLEELSRRCGIKGAYQNHFSNKGVLVGGAVWDIHALLKELDPAWIGCQYDIRHAVAECYGSWSVALQLIAPYINSFCLKDFIWEQRPDNWALKNVMGGQGVVPWDEYLKLCHQLELHRPNSVHIEWPLLSKEEQGLPKAQKRALVIERLRPEVAFYQNNFKKWKVET